jgi:hypothetical protein
MMNNTHEQQYIDIIHYIENVKMEAENEIGC